MCVLSDPHLSLPPDLAPRHKEFSPLQVAGFHRAVPSTTLDKASMQFVSILLIFSRLSTVFFISSKKFTIAP